MVQRVKDILSLALHAALSFVAGFVVRPKKLIVFCNYDGRGYGDNLAPIADEILRRQIDCEIVWLVKDLGILVPPHVRKVLRGRFREKLWLSRAKVVVCNQKGIPYWKHKGSFYIQTWHGDMPYKHIEAECGEMLSYYYRRMSQADSRRTDFVLSGSSFFSGVARSSFWYPEACKILEYGIPRNDVFFKRDEEEVVTFKKDVIGDSKVRIALYAPTFRECLPNANCRLDAQRLRQVLMKRFGGEWAVVVRLHPNVADQRSLFAYGNGVIDGTSIDKGQLLSLASDILITDYSSITEEFVILKKPIFLYAPDLDDYRQKERRLRELYFKLPFPRAASEEVLLELVQSFDEKVYQKELSAFLESEYRIFDDGHASERVVDLIETLLPRS